MYIEYNGHWTHGRHWFDGNNPKDVETLNLWKERGTDYYLSAIQIWTGYDIRKRDDAMKNALNYVVFWGTEFDDVEFWFRYGCPNGCDWYEMYSWVG